VRYQTIFDITLQCRLKTDQTWWLCVRQWHGLCELASTCSRTCLCVETSSPSESPAHRHVTWRNCRHWDDWQVSNWTCCPSTSTWRHGQCQRVGSRQYSWGTAPYRARHPCERNVALTTTASDSVWPHQRLSRQFCCL